MQKRKFVGILVIVALVLFVQPFVQPALASINGSTGHKYPDCGNIGLKAI